MGTIQLKDALAVAANTAEGIDASGATPIEYSNTVWEDMLGPLAAQRLDVSSGRIDYNYFNGAIDFATNARYPEEPAGIRMQIPHRYKVGTNGKPHLHWKQQGSSIPNWLIAWKLSENGESDLIETDYTNYTFGVLASHTFTYTSGVLNQISIFPTMDLSTANISDLLHVILFRDSANTSGLFAGSDPSAVGELATDLDIHIEFSTPGSAEEYTK